MDEKGKKAGKDGLAVNFTTNDPGSTMLVWMFICKEPIR